MLLTCGISSSVIWLKFCSHLTSFNNPKKLKKPNILFFPSPPNPQPWSRRSAAWPFSSWSASELEQGCETMAPKGEFFKGKFEKKNRPEQICWGKLDQQLMWFSDGKLPPETSPNVLLNPLGKGEDHPDWWALLSQNRGKPGIPESWAPFVASTLCFKVWVNDT